MPLYRIEEVDEGFGMAGIIVALVVIGFLLYIAFYVAIYVGIPALIIWIIYKLVKRHKRKKAEIIQKEQEAIMEMEQKREDARNSTTKRLLELDQLRRKGILSKDQYDAMAAPLIKNLSIINHYQENAGVVTGLYQQNQK